MKMKQIKNKLILGIVLIGVLMVINCVSYKNIINESYQRLENYNIKTINTEYGIMSFVDEGSGEVIVISHGIFGGYDQGYGNLYEIFGDNYRKIAISRFGYPGSNLPSEPTPSNQAKVFIELLDELQIEKVFLLAVSAGSAPGIRFALDYPERLKGLILLSSGVPTAPKTRKEIGRTGPPNFILNDRIMLFSIRNFRGIFYTMFGSKNVSNEVFNNLLPVKPRRNGIINDGEITNVDMLINYYDYPIENIDIPILIVHAKDDPMTKFEDIELILERINAETMIFPDGGHLIVGHDISNGIMEFINRNK
jgi:pimeloyl-ACP methyl ester carboxylesterase